MSDYQDENEEIKGLLIFLKILIYILIILNPNRFAQKKKLNFLETVIDKVIWEMFYFE